MKKVTKVRLMERLRVRFGLEELTPEMFAVLEKIIPITSIDRLAQEHGALQYTLTSITGTGYKTVYTVPAGKSLTITSIWIRTISGTWTLNEWLVTDDSTNQNYYWEDTFTATTDKKVWCTQPIVLEEGDQVKVNIFAHSATGNLGITFYGYIEDLF